MEPTAPPAVRFRGATIERRGRRVFEQLDLDIAARGVSVIGGANGSGKTSVMLAVAGLLRITSGSLVVAGADLGTRRGRRAAARSIGYLPQDPSFPPSFPVDAFLEYCCYLAGVPRRATAEAVEGALVAADLASERRRPLQRLSGGQRRRALVAGAAIGQPAVLVLDEPGVGIDAPHRESLRRQLRTLAEHSAVLVSSHIAEDFESLADAVVFFRDGGVAYAGGRDGFLAHGELGGPSSPASAAERALLALAGRGAPR